MSASLAIPILSSKISQNLSWSPLDSRAIRGRLRVTTPRFIRPELTSTPFSSFHPCRKERHPIGALKEPVNSTILSYDKTSGYIRFVAHSRASCLIS